MLLNRTRGRALGFRNELESRGLRAGATRFSFAAAFADVDLDGDPDLYVANDFGRNALYVNDGTGRFEERAEASGVVDTAAGMGACFADLDQNGSPDLYVSNMESSAGRRITGATAFRPAMNPELGAIFKRHAKGNSLFLGRGDGTFDSTTLAEAGRWAWGSIQWTSTGTAHWPVRPQRLRHRFRRRASHLCFVLAPRGGADPFRCRRVRNGLQDAYVAAWADLNQRIRQGEPGAGAAERGVRSVRDGPIVSGWWTPRRSSVWTTRVTAAPRPSTSTSTVTTTSS